jgi:hypothetical protein
MAIEVALLWVRPLGGCLASSERWLTSGRAVLREDDYAHDESECSPSEDQNQHVYLSSRAD